MDFELGYVCLFNSWAEPVVGHCGHGFEFFLVQGACPDCVDSQWGAEFGLPVQVEGGEADFAAEGLSGDDFAGGKIGEAEVFIGGGDVASLDFFPDAGAAEFDSVEVDAVHWVDFDAALRTLGFEQGCVSFTALAELEALADTDRAEGGEEVFQPIREFIGWDFRKILCERMDMDSVCPGFLEEAHPVFLTQDHLGRLVRPEDLAWMGVEGEGDCFPAVGFLEETGLGQDGAVSCVDAIKDADG